MIYFISDKNGNTKIGQTSMKLSSRVSQLQTGCPYELSADAAIYFPDGCLLSEIDIERSIHMQLHAYRVRAGGEWFQTQKAMELFDGIRNNREEFLHIIKNGGFCAKRDLCRLGEDNFLQIPIKFEKYREEENSMTLPSYDKTKRRKSFTQLPKGAYVIKIMNAKEDKWPSGDACVKIAFDIAEGEYAGFYQKMFDGNTNEDRKWPMDAVFTLNVPSDNSQDYVWTNWNTFFADLEDSNSGFVFSGDLKALKGKVIGGLFRIRQSSYNGNVYDHTELKWTRAADDVRSGNYGKLPNDKLVAGGSTATKTPDPNDFVSVPDGIEEELPF